MRSAEGVFYAGAHRETGVHAEQPNARGGNQRDMFRSNSGSPLWVADCKTLGRSAERLPEDSGERAPGPGTGGLTTPPLGGMVNALNPVGRKSPKVVETPIKNVEAGAQGTT